MEWKPYYDAELRQPGTRDKIVDWLRAAGEDDALSTMIGSGTVFSFPHTGIDYSGPIQTRVVAALYRAGIKRVIALGLIHGSLVPAYRVAMDESASQGERADAFEHVSGAVLPAKRDLETPFGTHPVAAVTEPMPAEIRVDADDLLQNEFSLDTFHSVLRLTADVFQVELLPILPLFIGMTRHPITGSFETAARLAHWLREQWDDETAIVTTGDVVHYGAVYGSEHEGVSPVSLESRIHARLEELFANAFEERDLETAYQISLHGLKSDQREILPILSHLLGEAACAELLTFELSDYASILDTDPPCLVASALIAYQNRNVVRLKNRNASRTKNSVSD